METANTKRGNMKIHIHMLISLGFLTAFICACEPIAPTPVNINVKIAAPTRNTYKSEEIQISNCNGNINSNDTLGSKATIQQSITIDDTANGIDTSDYIISINEKLQFEIEINNAYQPIYTNTVSRLEDTKLIVPPSYETAYTVQWEKLDYGDYVSFSRNNDVYKVSYIYELLIPNLLYKEESICPGVSTPTVQTSLLTSTPNTTPTLSPTTYTVSLKNDDFLYKGPQIGYGLVARKKRLRGESFTVVAKNAYGDWFLVQAFDGTRGWLYFLWINIDFKQESIPTTTDYPPAPTSEPTTRPKHPGSYP